MSDDGDSKMKAWDLKRANTVLEVLDIDGETRQVRKVMSLKLKHPMTLSEAKAYMDAHFPFDSPRDRALEKDLK